jgi:ubiquinone/menaquinone biosynthesis C-methylase UbiE
MKGEGRPKAVTPQGVEHDTPEEARDCEALPPESVTPQGDSNLPRVLEPEVMDSEAEARDYDAMNHAAVNRVFAADFLAAWDGRNPVLDVGTGTALIPVELCRQSPAITLVGIDLAEHMLAVGRRNVTAAGLDARIRLEKVDAKRLPFADGAFAAVVSNSIVHHIPQPGLVLAEMVRVAGPGGVVFVRDLLRPADEAELTRLVGLYGGDEAHGRQMFADSLRAALTLEEVRGLVGGLGLGPDDVRRTTDRHWTWLTRRPGG